jgi:ribonucleoside-triphosphate reductase
MKVLKRNNKVVPFDESKIEGAVKRAYQSKGKKVDQEVLDELAYIPTGYIEDETVSVETLQDRVEQILMDLAPYDVAKAYILYREQHKESRFVRERIDYMDRYADSKDNAATSSETDPNANVTQKNVANLEGEVYKEKNRVIQRQRMKDKLYEMFPEVAKQYEEDVDSHIIYPHDEASSPTLKQYCMAVSLYPLMMEGVGNIDGVTPSEPNDLQSFSGQITNLTFLLSSQCKGAVAFGEYFVALNYYIIKEFGTTWYEKLDIITTTEHCSQKRTIKDQIHKAFKQFIYGVNQPAGNRSYQSPLRSLVLSNNFCIFVA